MLTRLILAAVLQAAGAPPDEARIIVHAAQVEGAIDARLYGQFLEFMFEGVKGGLAAELVRNRGFEAAANTIGLSRYWERYPDDRNDDYGMNFRWDDSVAYPVLLDFLEEAPVQHALRVDVGDGVVQRHGVYQPRIPLWAGMEAIPVRAPSGADRLPRAPCGSLRRERALWVDQVSLMPENAVGGARADVEARVRALRPAFIRWPGGNVAQDYRWMWGVGARDKRPVWSNLSWKNEPEPGDIGTDEFIAFSRRVGAEPSITVNVEGRGATAEECAILAGQLQLVLPLVAGEGQHGMDRVRASRAGHGLGGRGLLVRRHRQRRVPAAGVLAPPLQGGRGLQPQWSAGIQEWKLK